MRAYRKIDEPYELKIEGGRLVLLGVGAVLTLILVFLVGVLVGKGLWGAKDDRGAALLAGSSPSPSTEPAKPQYTFYKDLTRPDGEVAGVQAAAPEKVEAVAGTPVSAPSVAGAQTSVAVSGRAPSAPAVAGGTESTRAEPEKTEPAKTEPAKAQRPKTAESRPEDASPSSEPAKPSRPTEPSKTPPKAAPQAKPDASAAKANGQNRLPTPAFTVQVGSFRDRASADDQAKKIIGQGVSAQVVLVSVEGRTWYRVQVGRFETRADAEAHYQKKLRPKGVQGFVTAR